MSLGNVSYRSQIRAHFRVPRFRRAASPSFGLSFTSTASSSTMFMNSSNPWIYQLVFLKACCVVRTLIVPSSRMPNCSESQTCILALLCSKEKMKLIGGRRTFLPPWPDMMCEECYRVRSVVACVLLLAPATWVVAMVVFAQADLSCTCQERKSSAHSQRGGASVAPELKKFPQHMKEVATGKRKSCKLLFCCLLFAHTPGIVADSQ